MQYKVGDRFRVVNRHPDNTSYEGLTGVVEQVLGTKRYEVLFENGVRCQGWTDQNDMEFISNDNKTQMKTLGTMMKRLLDKDTQTLVKAGFVNGDLELTEEGRKALLAIQFSEKKSELVILAQEVLDEERESKK